MYDEQTFQPGAKEASSALALQISTTEQPWQLDDTLQPSQPKLESNALLVLPLGLIAVWAIALVYVRQQQKRHANVNGLSSNKQHRQSHQVPCRSCLFFKDSPHLKCAVNPTNALTQLAIDCPDYTPRIPFSRQK